MSRAQDDAVQRVTIFDVAQRAGVSKSLVSLVMRDSARVSEVRRAAVLRAAAELGYRPNLMARSLAESRTRTVGVLVSDLRNAFFAEVVDGLQRAAGESGLRLLLSSGRRRADEEREALEGLLQLRVDGLVLLAPVLRGRGLAEAVASVPAAVVASHGVRVPRVDLVVADEGRGTELAVAHLAALGHVRIAHIDGGDGAAARERRAGYAQAMAAHGLGDRLIVAPGAYTDAGGYAGMRALLEGGEAPTAVLAANDLCALGAYAALAERGLRVPQDVSLVGYDDSYLARLPHLPLTSVGQPRAEMGRLALGELARRMKAPGARGRTRTVAPALVVRGSTAPPAA